MKRSGDSSNGDNIKRICCNIEENIVADRLSLFDKVQRDYIQLAEKERCQFIPYILSLNDFVKTYMDILDKSITDKIWPLLDLYLVKYENRIVCPSCKYYGYIEYIGEVSSDKAYGLISCKQCGDAFVCKRNSDIFIYKYLYILKADEKNINSHVIEKFEPRHKLFVTFLDDGIIHTHRFNIY